ncbi:MAG TPA: hypothetical protein VIA06_18655 [Candidatus Dormibacteraeota bacterium]|jgi:hypothetical protein|nr:hypothetical protein [Candidatus Dormibacteraeota bacterium]
MAVQVDSETVQRVPVVEEGPAVDTTSNRTPSERAAIQLGVVVQRDELHVAVARVLRERWNQKATVGLAGEDGRGRGEWMDVLAEHCLRSVSEEHEGDRQYALAKIAAAALAALEAGHRQNGEQRGVEELSS